MSDPHKSIDVEELRRRSDDVLRQLTEALVDVEAVQLTSDFIERLEQTTTIIPQPLPTNHWPFNRA